MNKDETAHELSFNIIEAMFHQFINQNKYYFDVHTFIGQQINTMSLEDGDCAGTTINIMIKQTEWFLTLS